MGDATCTGQPLSSFPARASEHHFFLDRHFQQKSKSRGPPFAICVCQADRGDWSMLEKLLPLLVSVGPTINRDLQV
jgi:hypothetical protein